MKAQRIVEIMRNAEFIEVGVPQTDAMTRRVMRDERFAILAAIQSGDQRRIDATVSEALRVAKMWRVAL